MRKETLKSVTTYYKPLCWLIDIISEDILCQSVTDENGKNEAYNAWNNYENDGWH